MKIVIPEIPKEGLDVEIKEDVEYQNISVPTEARLRIEKLDAEVIVTGNLLSELSLQCSRCLKDFSREFSLPVHLVYHPLEEFAGEDTYEVRHEELDMDFYSGEELDLSSLIREQVLLNMPMKPLCDESCRGICPVCGKNLNIESCTCDKTKTDARFEELRKLLQKRKEKEIGKSNA
jgi:uncharacterized protein